MRRDTAEAMLVSLDKQLQHIARQVRDLADHPRAEYADLLQEARIGAWQAWHRAQQKPRRNPRQYILAGARSQAEQYIWRLQRTPLYSAKKLLGTHLAFWPPPRVPTAANRGIVSDGHAARN